MRRPIAGTLALLVLLGGCGGGDDTTSTESAGSDALASARVEEARACLAKAGFEVVGGVSDPVADNAPDAELVLSVGNDQVFVAFYRDSETAAEGEERVRETIGSTGLIDREGSVTVIWGTKPDAGDRVAVAGCAFA
jgi:hypothetical protein